MQPGHPDALADSDSAYLVANGVDEANGLVPQSQWEAWWADVTFGDMQVCVAHPTGGDPQPYLRAGWLRNGKLLKSKGKLFSGKGIVEPLTAHGKPKYMPLKCDFGAGVIAFGCHPHSVTIVR